MRLYSVQSARSRESGQTLALVALFLVVLLAAAALAIDLTTLYVARGEMQRAADAAALAGAKAFVMSGVTTSVVGDGSNGHLRTLAQNIANSTINSLLAQDKVGGVAPSLVGTPTFDFDTHQGDPRITVTLQRTDVPTFFARVFGQRLATVNATATAEAYNSSNAGAGSNMPPVGPSCVKPWLVPNFDPGHCTGGGGSLACDPFVNADGTLPHSGVWSGPGTGIIGERITLGNIWANCGGPLCGLSTLPGLLTLPRYLGYLPANIASASGPCPSCSVGLPSPMSQSVACCDTANEYQCGSTTSNVLVDLLHQRVISSLEGAACLLTGGTGGGSGTMGDDRIDFSDFQSSNGSEPILIRSGNLPHSGQYVTTSNQIVTLPIIDTTVLNTLLGRVKVIGFMQAFVEQTHNDGDVVLDVLNISGCGSNVNPALTPISGGGTSPVPVRLIHN